MKWQKVREKHPNEFVKFGIVKYHEDEKIKYVGEVAVIKDGIEAMNEFTKCKKGKLVYSIENKSIAIDKIKHIVIR